MFTLKSLLNVVSCQSLGSISSAQLLLRHAHTRMLVPERLSAARLLQDRRTLEDGRQPVRGTGFFTNLTADQLWKSMTSVSNAGKKRGRGRGSDVVRRRDLNRGQQIGVGREPVLFPGLTTPVVRGAQLVRQQQLPVDPEREQRLQLLRSQMASRKRTWISPLERGWSGNKLPGRRLGPPEPIDYEAFDGFETIALELKTVFTMTARGGRTRHISCFVVTGNGNGLAGFGLGKGNTGAAAISQSKRRASQRLMYIERSDENSVLHDFYTRFAKVRILVERRPRGHGLQCHRAISEICKCVGITDLYAKVEGPTGNVQNITRAFFLGLLRQRTHQQLADQRGRHLVEVQPGAHQYPRLLASPQNPHQQREEATAATTAADDLGDFQLYMFEGKVPLKMPPKKPFYTRLPGYQKHLNCTKHLVNHEQVRVQLAAEYGDVRSFLTEKYPECRGISEEVWAEMKRQREAAEGGDDS